MSGLIYYITDTETTGLNANYHEVFQISVIRCNDRHQFSKYIKIEHPERVSAKALEVTGKTLSDLRFGSPKELVVDQLHNWLLSDGKTAEDRCMVGHNIAFDRRFCHSLWESVGKTFPVNCWLDTENIAKTWAVKFGIEKPKRLSLQAALQLVQVKPFDGAHDAISDSRNTYLIWKKAEDEGLDYLSHIKRQSHQEL